MPTRTFFFSGEKSLDLNKAFDDNPKQWQFQARKIRHIHLELEGDIVSAKVCLELCADVDGRGLAGAVLHNQEQFGHNLDHMTGLNRIKVVSMMGKK